MGDISVQFGTKLWEQAATSSQDKTWNGDGVKEDVRPSTMGPVAVILSYSLHKTYHQRIALYCAAYLCLCSLSFVHTLATRAKTVKELLQLNWSIIDHYYLHCYTGWSMDHGTGADDDIFTAGYYWH